MKRIILTVLVAFLMVGFTANAQTAEELKAAREVLKAELMSKERLKTIAKLEKMKMPSPCEIGAIDKLASGTAEILKAFRGGEFNILGQPYTTKGLNYLVPEMYKRTVGESIDGVIDVTVEKPTAKEIAELTAILTNVGLAIADISKEMANAGDQVKSASPTQAIPAAKALKYTVDNITFLVPEIELQGKIIANLIATLKSANNL